MLVDIAQLQQLLSTGGCLIFDCRFSLADDQYGQTAYQQGHIPTAQHADLNQQLSGLIIPGETGRHPLPARDVFAAQVCRWGIDNTSRIIAYDDNLGVYAARFWWMLRWLGHENVQVLDGGWDAWLAAGGSLDTTEAVVEPSVFTPKNPLTRIRQANELLQNPGDLTDAREPARFRGEIEPLDAIAGHIPGAVCMPFTENLVDGRFKSRQALGTQFEARSLNHDSDVTCYCGSGVTAAHNILALVFAGFSEPALYPGSWSEWITDPSRPIATGD